MLCFIGWGISGRRRHLGERCRDCIGGCGRGCSLREGTAYSGATAKSEPDAMPVKAICPTLYVSSLIYLPWVRNQNSLLMPLFIQRSNQLQGIRARNSKEEEGESERRGLPRNAGNHAEQLGHYKVGKEERKVRQSKNVQFGEGDAEAPSY